MRSSLYGTRQYSRSYQRRKIIKKNTIYVERLRKYLLFSRIRDHNDDDKNSERDERGGVGDGINRPPPPPPPVSKRTESVGKKLTSTAVAAATRRRRLNCSA